MTALAEPAPTTTQQLAVALPFRIAPHLPHIREFRDEDSAAVARMWRESVSVWPGGGPGGGEHSTAARVSQEQRDLNTLATFIAWAPDPGGEPGTEVAAGYCSLFDYASEADTAYVGTLSAHPAWHGRGIGRDLLKAALERTVALGYSRLDLNTWAGNMKAVPLYKKSGYFWVPETTVKMENYLPLIFRLAPAQAFFQNADWYADFTRDVTVKEDDEKLGQLGVYAYAWEREGRRLKVVIDRKAKGIVGLETERFAVSTSIDDPKLPIGTHRTVSWRVENQTGSALPVSILAEGEDSVRCSLQTSSSVSTERAWSAPVTAEQPQGPAPARRPANRVRTTAVIEGAAIPLVVGTNPVQPLDVSLDHRHRWFVPGQTRRLWIDVENNLGRAARGTLHLSAPEGVAIEPRVIAVTLEGSAKASYPVQVTVQRAGSFTMRAQATLEYGESDPSTNGSVQGGHPLRTAVFEQALLCGEPGSVFVERGETSTVLSSDRLVVSMPLRPQGSWEPVITVSDRESGAQILRHTLSVGPPFVPSVFTRSTWKAAVVQDIGATTVTLSTTPDVMPDLTVERTLRLSASGLIKVAARVINTGATPRALTVTSGTGVELSMARGTQVAVPLASGLIVEDSNRFPDWSEPDVTRPERYAEQWMAEFGDGWVGATIWRDASEIEAGWEAPTLSYNLGEIPPGATVETPPVYLYAGQGDWKTARALWRQLMAPDAPAEHPEPQRAHAARLERTVFDSEEADTAIVLSSERTRSISGSATLEVAERIVAQGAFTALDVRTPARIPAHITLPGGPGAVPAALVLDHQRSTERVETSLIRTGDANASVEVRTGSEHGREVVTLDNGRLRLTLAPSRQASVISLEVRHGQEASSVEQLHTAWPDPMPFIWFNPWYGGIHPVLGPPGGRGSYPGKLSEETFTWREANVTGVQGNRWRGVTAAADCKKAHPGLRVEISYLTTGDSNLLAIVSRLENGGAARFRGQYSVGAFLAPGGERDKARLHYLRQGERVQKRVHGGTWAASERWCAVEPPTGPVIAAVAGSPEAHVFPRDMGLEGVHPVAVRDITLEPGGHAELVAYYVFAAGLGQARLYRHLAGSGSLV